MISTSPPLPSSSETENNSRIRLPLSKENETRTNSLSHKLMSSIRIHKNIKQKKNRTDVQQTNAKQTHPNQSFWQYVPAERMQELEINLSLQTELLVGHFIRQVKGIKIFSKSGLNLDYNRPQNWSKQAISVQSTQKSM